MSERAELVTKLVREGPLSSSEFDRLHSFGWDSEEDLATLTRADAVTMLRRYVHGDVSADDLFRGAGQIDAREDIGFEEGHETDLFDLIFELATQELHAPWNSDVARRWLVHLA